MATYGIVVGIRDYESPGVPGLVTPVEDALRMVAWLVTKGSVSPDKLIVLLSPITKTVDASMTQLAQTLRELKMEVADFEKIIDRLDKLGNLKLATKVELLKAMLAVDGKARNGGERLYFYYAGHGLASRISFSNEDAIVPSDYLDVVTKAISVSSIVRYFQSLKFPEQLFFFDCCRNLLINEQSLDMAPVPKPLDLTSRVPDQFVYNATAPGLKALDGRGLLTDALIDGLLGKGSAVDWVGKQKSYVVRAVRLFDYISQRYATRPEAPVVGTNQIQEPKLGGEHNLEPIVATLPEAEVPPVNLKLIVSPDGVRPIREVRLTTSGASFKFEEVNEIPLTVSLKPRTYFLEIEVGDQWTPGGDPSPWELKVFDPQEYPVTFTQNSPQVVVPAGPAAAPAGGAGSAGNSEGGSTSNFTPSGAGPGAGPILAPAEESSRSLGPVAMAPAKVALGPEGGGGGTPGFGHLIITCNDPMAMIEVVDGSGAPLLGKGGQPLMGTSPLDCPNLRPGRYRARLKTPEGIVGEKMVLAEDGQVVPVSLVVPAKEPSGVVLALADRFKSLVGDDFMKRVSLTTQPSLMSVLALARESLQRAQSAGDEEIDLDEDVEGARGLEPDPGPLVEATLGLGGQGIVIVLAADMAMPLAPAEGDQAGPDAAERLDSPEKVEAYLRSIAIRCGPFEQALGAPAAPEMTPTPGIAGLALPTSPGPAWLSVTAPTPVSNPSVAFVLAVLPDRTTRLLIHQEGDGHIHALQFLPSTRPDVPTDPEVLRRLDLAQHFLLGGKLGEMGATLEPLLIPEQPDRLDPITGCLAGHLMIRDRQMDRLKALGDRMVALFPELPDSHLLRAFHRDATGHAEEAVAGYTASLDRGFPITAHFLHRLAEGVARRKIQHPRTVLLAQVAARLVPGGLWSAWLTDPDWDGTSAPDQGRESQPLQSSTSVTSPTNSRGATTMQDDAPVTFDPKAFENLGPAAPTGSSDVTSPVLCSNQPNGGPYVKSDPSTEAQRTRAMADKTLKWADGQTLKVVFLNGANDAWGQTLQKAVREIAPIWSDYANIKFDFVPPPQAHITINFFPLSGIAGVGTYNSWIGKSSLQFVGKQPTMNLVFSQDLATNPAFMQQEFHRVIIHEFGHAIGFIHEHMRPNNPIHWNEQALLRTFGPGTLNNWSKDMIHQQIMDFYQPSGGAASLLGGAFDLNSIMMYQFQAGLATFDDGTPFQTPNNVALSPLDKVVANLLYPATGVDDPDEVTLVPGDSPVDGSIEKSGQVARFSFQPASGAIHVVETQGSTPLLVSLFSLRDDPAGRMLAVEGSAASLSFLPKSPGNPYFIQVRHAQPMSGTGDFSISVRAQS
jgi:hypothetical protein